MRFLVLVPSQRGYSPGQRSSIELWERVLADVGMQLDFVPFETTALRAVLAEPGHTWAKTREMVRSLWRRGRTVADLADYDAVVVYREAALLGPAFFERWIAHQGKPMIYLLDDPLYVPYVSPINGYLSYLKFFGKVSTICRLSRVVIVNSPQHREFAARFNSNVREIPSLVDEGVFHFVRKVPGCRPCVGWSGSPSTAANLNLIAEPLRELSRRLDFDLHFIGATRFPLIGVQHTAQEWRAQSEAEDLRRLDIGLVPLPDNEWNRRKFYLKVAQYMALGVVPVATPLGSNVDVIEHGKTGYLAGSPEEWVTYLERLVADPGLRADMSRRAAEVARERFTLGVQTKNIVEAFHSVLG